MARVDIDAADAAGLTPLCSLKSFFYPLHFQHNEVARVPTHFNTHGGSQADRGTYENLCWKWILHMGKKKI